MVVRERYTGNEQKLCRNPSVNPRNQTMELISSDIDDKTRQELYMSGLSGMNES